MYLEIELQKLVDIMALDMRLSFPERDEKPFREELEGMLGRLLVGYQPKTSTFDQACSDKAIRKIGTVYGQDIATWEQTDIDSHLGEIRVWLFMFGLCSQKEGHTDWESAIAALFASYIGFYADFAELPLIQKKFQSLTLEAIEAAREIDPEYN